MGSSDYGSFLCELFCFDFLMAAFGGKIIKECTGSKALSIGAYAALLFLPAVIFNSAFLGQSDAIFTAFVLLAVLMLMKKHYFWSFIFLGCAFSFKLQFVFIIPLFVICYVCMSKFSVLNFVLIPLTLMVLSIPAYIAGRPVMDVFKIYFFQVYQYHDMSLGYPSFWYVINIADFKAFYKFAILLTIAVLGFVLYYTLKRKIDMSQPKTILLVGALTAWTCVFFLPDMHERYGYMTDILMVLLCFAEPEFVPFAVVPPLLSTSVYFGHYGDMNMRIVSGIAFAAYALFMRKWISKTKSLDYIENA